MREQPPTREPLLGAEVREAARFCMRLVRDQANICQRLLRLVEIGFPELKEARTGVEQEVILRNRGSS